MDKEYIFQIIKNNIADIVPEILENGIRIEDSLKELGANSVDRMDIVIKTMETLEIKIPLVELGRAANIQSLVDLLYDKKYQSQ